MALSVDKVLKMFEEHKAFDFGSEEKSEHIKYSDGMESWLNPINKWRIIALHYSADPRKNPSTDEGLQWLTNEIEGKTDGSWLQEYEMSGKALGLSAVYPMVSMKTHGTSLNIQTLFDSGDLAKYPIIQAIDPGIDAQTAAVWLMLDPDGYIVFFHEYYVRNRSIQQNAKAILAIEDKYKIKPIVRIMDKAAFKRMLTGVTPANEYRRYGIHCIPGPGERDNGIAMVRTMLEKKIDDVHKVLFSTSMKHTFDEFLHYVIKNGKPLKKHDHLMDAIRYALCYPKVLYHGKAQPKIKSVPLYRDPLTGYIFPHYVQKEL